MSNDIASLIVDVVPHAMKIFKQEMRKATKEKLSIPQFRILIKVAKGDKYSQEISDWLGVSPPTMTKLLDSLEKKGFVTRAAHPTDRRKHIIKITKKGEIYYKECKKDATLKFSELVDQLSKDDQSILCDGLKILAKLVIQNEIS